MNNAEKHIALKQVLALTLSMQDKADNALWDELTDIELQRQAVISAIFPLENLSDNTAERVLIEQIIEANSLLEKQCKHEKEAIKLQVMALNKNKTAVSAYSSA